MTLPGQSSSEAPGPFPGQSVSSTPPGINELLAMAPPVVKQWQTCPVCFGRCQVDASFYAWPTPGSSAAILHGPVSCRSCGGRGIV